ncbi:hypothetical protein ECC02_006206 [Trypanosoma cruzi]|uniref:Uncharacterized protein n=1 Tax=Trypanosoma cruzi TaxID=5693 RepID=A0A7J6Y2U8_TRYCR|nr:hypothetical protein ECC02_006206 [Trypanosoma cruzi]
MCVLSVSQRWSLPFLLPFSLEYPGRVTNITVLLSSTSSIVAVVNPLLTSFTFSSCLLPHTRESVPSASVHDSPLSPDSYTLRRPSSHAVIMMSFLSFHSTTEGSPQSSADISDSVQFGIFLGSMTSKKIFVFLSFFVASTGNKSVSSVNLTPEPPPPISSVKGSLVPPKGFHWRRLVSFQSIFLLSPASLTSPFTSKSPQPSAPPT